MKTTNYHIRSILDFLKYYQMLLYWKSVFFTSGLMVVKRPFGGSQGAYYFLKISRRPLKTIILSKWDYETKQNASWCRGVPRIFDWGGLNGTENFGGSGGTPPGKFLCIPPSRLAKNATKMGSQILIVFFTKLFEISLRARLPLLAKSIFILT